MDGITLENLYARIPAFSCLPGCTDCCGPIVMTRQEWERFPKKRFARSLADDCPYSGKGKCDFYEQRPLICRMFGTTLDMLCPYGCRPDKYLSKRKAKEIMAIYRRMIALDGERFITKGV